MKRFVAILMLAAVCSLSLAGCVGVVDGDGMVNTEYDVGYREEN